MADVEGIEFDRSLKGAHVAQSVEHVLGKDEVTGSIPVVGSMTEIVFYLEDRRCGQREV
jgi:hypothetical protein